MSDQPDCPPIVLCGLSEPHPAFLLAWELVAGEWWAWVAWIRERRGQPYRHVVSVHSESVRPIEAPVACRSVPRRVRGTDGVVRPWPPSARPGSWCRLRLIVLCVIYS